LNIAKGAGIEHSDPRAVAEGELDQPDRALDEKSDDLLGAAQEHPAG
jgi:hypothetical protein